MLKGSTLFGVDCRYDFMASKTNALIVPACGFGSIPPDLLVFVSNRYVKAVLGPEASIEDSVTAYDVRGGFSGGTGETMMSQVEDVPWETLVGSGADYAACHRKLLANVIPQALKYPARSPWTSQPSHKIRVQDPVQRVLVVVRGVLATTTDQPPNGPPLLVIIRTQQRF